MVCKQIDKNTANMVKKEIQVMKKCPICERRIFDKITPTSGMIEMKCPHCHKLIRVNLALRRCPSHAF